MKNFKKLMLILSVVIGLSTSQNQAFADNEPSGVGHLILLSTFMAPELLTVSAYGVVGSSFTMMRFTEMLEKISYKISVSSDVDTREVLDLRDDAVEFLADGYKTSNFEFFSNRLRESRGVENMSDEQVASLVIALGAAL